MPLRKTCKKEIIFILKLGLNLKHLFISFDDFISMFSGTFSLLTNGPKYGKIILHSIRIHARNVLIT